MIRFPSVVVGIIFCFAATRAHCFGFGRVRVYMYIKLGNIVQAKKCKITLKIRRIRRSAAVR